MDTSETKQKTIGERSKIIEEGVRYRARKLFHQGTFENPYGDFRLLDDCLKMGMSQIFEQEMESLIKSKCCPCCGQFSLGDFDW